MSLKQRLIAALRDAIEDGATSDTDRSRYAWYLVTLERRGSGPMPYYEREILTREIGVIR